MGDRSLARWRTRTYRNGMVGVAILGALVVSAASAGTAFAAQFISVAFDIDHAPFGGNGCASARPWNLEEREAGQRSRAGSRDERVFRRDCRRVR